MHRIHQIALTVLAAGSLALPLSAAGLLGERYAEVSYDFVQTGSARYDNGAGMTLAYNQPYSENVDLGASFQFAMYDAANNRPEVGDFSEQRLQVFATAYMPPERDRLWLRLGVGLGEVERDYSATETPDEEITDLSWLFRIGTEYAIGDKAAVTPYLGFEDILDDGETIDFVYGVHAFWDVAESIALSLRIEGNRDYNLGISLGCLARF